jgi:hypothetical protein
LVYLAGRSDQQILTTIPDDAFYYLQIALSRAHFGSFSFDLVSKTSGFHVLFGYLLALFLKLFPSLGLRQIWLSIGFAACILYSVSAEILAIAMRRNALTAGEGWMAGIAVVLAFTSPIASMASTDLMESVLLLPIYAVTFAALLDSERRIRGPWVYFLLGFVGVLTRSDFIVLPAAWLLASGILRFSGRAIRLVPAMNGFAGAVAAELLILLHNYLLTGHGTQMSAAIKFHWSQAAGHSVFPALSLVARTLLPSGLHEIGSLWLLLSGLALVGVVAGMALLNLLRSGPQSPSHLPRYLAASFICAGYVVIYRQDSSAIQLWYGANLIVPLAVFLAATVGVVEKYGTKTAAALVVVVYAGSSVGGVVWNVWKNQPQTYVAAANLRALSLPQRIGAWNAGIIKYFSKKDIINLDGLIDDEAADAVLENCLACFISRFRIEYIADNEKIFEPGYARRGGYSDGSLQTCSKMVEYLDDASVKSAAERWKGGRIALFHVDLTCLNKLIAGRA